MSEGFERAQEYHRNLPERIRSYLRDARRISDDAIEHHLLGWDGHRITIPIFNREGLFSFFKLAKDPDDASDGPKMLAPPGSRAELYGWERVLVKPEQIIICEGEFDRLVLESRGIAAVTSTGGAQVFRQEWAEDFQDIPGVYVVFDNDAAGRAGAERAARLIPQARLVAWPEEIGEGGDVTDFFVRLGRSREKFVELLARAEPLPEDQRSHQGQRGGPGLANPRNTEIANLKGKVAIQEIIRWYVALRPSGQTYVGNCPFHEDRIPSFTVYPQTGRFYCYGCRASGDVLTFLMRREQLTFPEAMETLKQLAP